MNLRFIIIWLVSLAFSCQLSHAATQGSLGNTSSGAARISVTKSIRAEITNVRDIIIDKNATSGRQDLCIYSSTGQYSITASGSGKNGAFTAQGKNHSLPYTLSMHTAGKAASLTPNQPVSVFAQKANRCSTARLAVQTAMANGMHGGVLTLTITPF